MSSLCLSISSRSPCFFLDRSTNHAATDAAEARNAIRTPAHVSMGYPFLNMVFAAFTAPSFFAVCEKMSR